MADRSATISAGTIPAGTAQLPLPWHSAAFSLASGLLDPIQGLLLGLPGWVIGAGSTRRWNTPRRRRRGLFLVLGGVEGPSIYQRYLSWGLLRAGWRGGIDIVRWNAGIPFWRAIVNLTRREHHERQSQRVASIIESYRIEHPRPPVGIIAMSGGCWIAVRAIECLASRTLVDTAALIVPAISPDYDLTRAAANCRRCLVTVGGVGDWVLLGLGTSLLGTSDRRFGPAAGWVGFHRAAAGVTHLRWRPWMARHGYLGNHISSSMPGFVAALMRPIVAGLYSASFHSAPSSR